MPVARGMPRNVESVICCKAKVGQTLRGSPDVVLIAVTEGRKCSRRRWLLLQVHYSKILTNYHHFLRALPIE